jgi:hypothetical protein
MKRNLQIIKILVLCGSVLGVGRMVKAQHIDDMRKFDEFYGSNWESAMARLDDFALEMRNNPQTIGVLIVYGAQRSRRGEARAWRDCLKNYLVSRRGIESNRIAMINGGYREDLTVELWETGDRKHIPNPQPQVKPKDVRFTKGKVLHLCEL